MFKFVYRHEILLKSVNRLVCLMLASVAMTVQADSWVDIGSKPEDFFLQLDKESVAQVAENVFSATWRIGTGPKRPYFVKSATVDCIQESLKLTTKKFVDTDRLNSIDTVWDYAAEKTYWAGKPFNLSDAERADSSAFPLSTSTEGQLIRYVCQQNYLPNAKREAGAVAMQKELGCGSEAITSTPICAKDAATLETLHSLFFRLQQVERACSVSRKQTLAVMFSWLADVAECSRVERDCGISSIQSNISGLGADLARAATKQSCSYFSRSVMTAAENDGRRSATARFHVCVKQAIPAMDDNRSPADVVAVGVFGACRGELAPQQARSDVYEKTILPALTASVLQFRRIARTPVPKNVFKPKQPQS